jgi:hypothetical protein
MVNRPIASNIVMHQFLIDNNMQMHQNQTLIEILMLWSYCILSWFITKNKVLSFGTNQDYFLHDTSKTNLKVPFKIGYQHFPIV